MQRIASATTTGPLGVEVRSCRGASTVHLRRVHRCNPQTRPHPHPHSRPLFPHHRHHHILLLPLHHHPLLHHHHRSATFTCSSPAMMYEPPSRNNHSHPLRHRHDEDAPSPSSSSPSTSSGSPSSSIIPQSTSTSSIPPTSSLSETCAAVHARVSAFLSTPPRDKRMAAVQRQTRISLDVISEALSRYSLPNLSLSYNGGKDCLVLLILYLASLHTTPSCHPLPPSLTSIYIVSPNPFPAVTSFVAQSSAEYHLSLARSTLPMREAFSTYLAQNPDVSAIFVGTRRTDPHGAKLTHFDPTDHGWPKFVRIHPVIDWHYTEIWGFIREVGVRYCPLYDMGYTSLGGTTDTLPNPALRDEEREGGFRPAYELVEDLEERLGRE